MNLEVCDKFDKCKVLKAPNTIFYMRDFISESDEETILKNVYNAPKPKWTQLRNRRLQEYGGVPHVKGMIAEQIPLWLQNVMDTVTEVFPPDKRPNHVLVNEYLAGQGIMAHTDGPLFYPLITTISCGSHTILNIVDQETRSNVCRILLEPRSLVILSDEVYNTYLHSIDEQVIDFISDSIANLSFCSTITNDQPLKRDTRLSLTIRHVPKISKFKLKCLHT